MLSIWAWHRMDLCFHKCHSEIRIAKESCLFPAEELVFCLNVLILSIFSCPSIPAWHLFDIGAKKEKKSRCLYQHFSIHPASHIIPSYLLINLKMVAIKLYSSYTNKRENDQSIASRRQYIWYHWLSHCLLLLKFI